MERKPNEEAKVEMSQAKYDALMERLDRIENGGVFDPEVAKISTCYVVLHEGRPVSDVMRARRSGQDEYTGNEKMVCDIDVVDDIDEKGNAVVKHLKGIDYAALRSDFPRVDKAVIARRDERDISVTYGTVEQREASEWSMKGTGVRVPMRVKAVETTFIVAMPESHDSLLPKFFGKEVPLRVVNI